MDFIEQDLSGSRFARCNLGDAAIRGSWVAGLEIDTPDLNDGPIWVNGIDVTPFVNQQLNEQFPGRELKQAESPDGLRSAWAAVEHAWAEVMPTAAGREDVSVDGEWTFSQTLRHLVLATNSWLHGGIFQHEQPFHAIGMPFAEYKSEGRDMSIFREPSSYGEVLAVRAEHQAMVRDFLADVTSELLAEPRPVPWAPEHQVRVCDCLQVILNEEWEHLRYAVRDLALIDLENG